MRKKLLLFGGLGQDGSFLIEKLHKEYEIICPIKPETNLAEKLKNQSYLAAAVNIARFYYLDITNQHQIKNLIEETSPHLICNFAAYSNVFDPWAHPKEVIEINTIVPAVILQAMIEVSSKAKFVQASSSLVFGAWNQKTCNENTPRFPMLPYGISKNAADHLIQECRNSFGINACSAIFFNHESERRGKNFFSRKVVLAARAIANEENKDKLVVGDLDTIRDMGFARDHVAAVAMMLNEQESEDYVLGTGSFTSMRAFVEETFKYYGLNYKDHIVESKTLLRKLDTRPLVADIMKANKRLGWVPRKFCATTLIEDELTHEEL